MMKDEKSESSEMQMMDYEKPVLIVFESQITAGGACRPGPTNVVSCTTGNNAAAACGPGNKFGQVCGVGGQGLS